MAIGGISASPAIGIDQVLSQLRMAQARAQLGGLPAAGPAGFASALQGAAQAQGTAPAAGALRGTLSLSADDGVDGAQGSAGGDFMSVLKSSLDQVNASQTQASAIGKDFEMGRNNVDLNDVMVAMQKANVSFQGAVQVRNRLVAAYQTMMNMQI